jgi:hypothetical protein
MHIEYKDALDRATKVELASYLEPVNTGSEQGSLEQAAADIEVLKATIGKLLALYVETKTMTLEQAEDISGMHEYYRQYRFRQRTLVA